MGWDLDTDTTKASQYLELGFISGLLLLKLASSAKEWELDSLSPSLTFFNQEVKEYTESICTLTDCTHVH